MELFIDDDKPEFLCTTEHWQTDSSVAGVYLQDYTNIASFCRKRYIRGGAAIFGRNDVIARCMSLPYTEQVNIEMHFESVAVEFDGDTCIIAVYRSTSGEYNIFIDQMTKLLDYFVPKYKYVILCGDLNVDNLKDDNHAKTLRDLFLCYDLTPLIREPTRIVKDSKTGIDYVVTNITDDNNHCKVIPFPASDHTAQVFDWPGSGSFTDRPVDHCSRTFSDSGMREFAYLFTRGLIDLEGVISDNIDDVFGAFWTPFIYAFEASFPLVNRCVVGGGDDKIRFRYGHDLKTRYQNLKFLNYIRKNIDSNFTNEYRNCRYEFTTHVRNAKKKYYTELVNASGNKNRRLWEVVNVRVGRKKNLTKPSN